MILGIILFIIGIISVIYLSKIKFNRKLLITLGIILGVLLSIYGLILIIQPDDFIIYTKTTISN
jgi:hypothetical protein